MHRGVHEFIRWIDEHPDFPGLKLNDPASNADINHLEHQIGTPLPSDLRLVLFRFNGGAIPSGVLLSAGGPGGHTIESALRKLAQRLERDFLDPDLLLPFHRNTDGAMLAFDRSAGPVADTWPIVDYYEDTGELRLVHRTFDGWCRLCTAEWSSNDFLAEFSLDKYLRQGERHVAIETDVASAHATVAHAFRRAGKPEHALESYLRAARCIPPLAWCDWEALKLAALLGMPEHAYEAASRLATRGPAKRWSERETTPGRIADVVGTLAKSARDRSPWVRLLDQMAPQAGEAADRAQVLAVRKAVCMEEMLPQKRPSRQISVAPDPEDLERWWNTLREGYKNGTIRDEDLLLDSNLEVLRHHRAFADLLRIRRDF